MPRLKRPSPSVGFYSHREELLNSLSHGVGAVLGVVGLLVLVILASIHGNIWHQVSFTIYGITLILLFLASTLYHGSRQPEAKRFFRYLDHAAIYLFIAGTYTPFLMVNMRGPVGWTILAIVWLLALLGIAFKTLFVGRFETLSTIGYLLMGWLSLLAFREMVNSIPAPGIFWLLFGGAVYTLGVVFLAVRKIPYNHAIWHLFVLGGSAVHFFTILFFVLPLAAIVG